MGECEGVLKVIGALLGQCGCVWVSCVLRNDSVGVLRNTKFDYRVVVTHRIEVRMIVGKCGRVVGVAKGFLGTFGTVGVGGCLVYYVMTVWVSCVIRNLTTEW